jgi:hypothetical protein
LLTDCCCRCHDQDHCLGCQSLQHLLLLPPHSVLVGCQGHAAPGSMQLGCGPAARMTLTAHQPLQGAEAPAACGRSQSCTVTGDLIVGTCNIMVMSRAEQETCSNSAIRGHTPAGEGELHPSCPENPAQACPAAAELGGCCQHCCCCCHHPSRGQSRQSVAELQPVVQTVGTQVNAAEPEYS